MKKRRPRLDAVLVERGLFPTRAKALAAVMAGQVLVGGKPAAKAGAPTPEDAEIELLSPCPYVSRGGLKLEAALKEFGVSTDHRVCLDTGASTGGFTDCLLQHGAAKVYAVDVGRAQLDTKLRYDPRVVCREETHARDLKSGQFDPRPDLAVIDVSFISLTMILPHVLSCLAAPYEVLALVKPQFELGPKMTPKGIVRDPQHRALAVQKVRQSLLALPVSEAGMMECPVRGAKGNVEYFLHLKSQD